MKTIVSLSIAILLCTGFAMAQTMGSTVTPEAKPAADGKITWAAMSHDFKDTPQNIAAEVTFSFTNETGAPITISNVKTSCGCTKKHYTETAIMPGEKGEVTASYNAKNLGIFNKTVTVYLSNDPANGIKLKLTGNVVEGASGTN